MIGSRHLEATPRVSVLVPCRDEVDNIGPLISEIDAALLGMPREIIVIDDGSLDGTDNAVRASAAQIPGIRLIQHGRPFGQSAALRSGLTVARGRLIVTIDGDGQNDPAFLPSLLAVLEMEGGGIGLVAGQRIGRKASVAKRYGSRVANAVRDWMLKDGTRDSGCGLKAIPRELFLRLPYFNSWHRFLPALVTREGLRVSHVDVVDRPRRHGRSKYGVLDRLWIGIADLFGVWWLMRRHQATQWQEEKLYD